jgi:hypothetical protein
MAKPDDLQLLRAHLAGWTRPSWLLVLLFVGDLLELAGSVALAAMSPAPAAPRVPYPTFDLPSVPPATTLGVALVGIALGLLMGASLVGELVLVFRRTQILRWRHGTAAARRRAALRARCVTCATG